MADTPKILILDDEQRMCDSLEVLLSTEGYDAQATCNAQEAMARLAKNDFDLVLLDIVMPDMTGHEVMDHINEQHPDTLIIVITGHASVDSAVESLRRGAYDYLRKPFEFDQLVKRVKNALDQKRLKRECEIINGRLAVSERRYQYLVNNSPDIIYTLNHEGKFSFVGGAFESLLGYKHEELIGKNFTFTVFDYDIGKAKNHLNKTSRANGSSESAELKLKPCPGSGNRHRFLTMEFKSMGMYDHCGENGKKKFTGIYGVARDISGRKRAENALRESEERFRSLSENAPDIIYTLNLDGYFTYVNRAWEKILGHKIQEVVGRRFADFTRQEDATQLLSLFKRVRQGHETITDASCTFICKDGSDRLLIMSGTPNLDSEGKVVGVLGVFKDVTAQRKLELRLMQAQKMEAIGTLAGGIAHDFNNLLMGIQGRASLMSLNIDSDHPHLQHLKGLEEMVESGAGLTRQLLGFARGGKYEVKSIDLNELVEKSSQMFARTKKETSIRTNPQESIWPVEADRVQIEQVLLNLYVNACQAMDQSGHIYIETKNVVLRDAEVKPFGLEPGKYVRTSVTDTGVGMDKAVQERIFEPFFTTKEMGRGTGLGLASAYGIIKNHGGIINVDSQRGKGATFSVYLPATEKQVTQVAVPSDHLTMGTETILLVDDENMIIDVGDEILQEMGYRVLCAGGGKEAVEIYKARKGEIDMVILDMIMPDMGGGEAYDRMKEINPDVKVLLSSGYSIDGEASQILERGCDGFIQKPFAMRQLSESIRKVLDAR